MFADLRKIRDEIVSITTKKALRGLSYHCRRERSCASFLRGSKWWLCNPLLSNCSSGGVIEISVGSKATSYPTHLTHKMSCSQEL